MANTSLELLLGSKYADNLIDRGHILNEYESGELSTDMDPGSWVYRDQSTGKWIPLDADTAAHKLAGPGQVGVVLYEPHIMHYGSNNNKEFDNGTDYDVTYHNMAPICTSGIVGAKVVDQNAAVGTGTGFIASSTAESVTIQAQEATGATSGTAIKSNIVGTLAAELADNDTFGYFAIGKRMGDVLGGR